MKTKTPVFLLLILNILFTASCSKNNGSTSIVSEQFNTEIDSYIMSLIKADQIPGMAVAVVKDGTIIHKKNYGVANIVHNVPVTDSTLFRAYSTSKLVTAVAIFQLIEHKEIGLNDLISKYIDNLPTKWNSIEIEHLLSHSSGLPDIIDYNKDISDKLLLTEISKKPIQFEKGQKFQYNQTNFWFLKLIIEKVTNQTFETFVRKNQFENNEKQVIFASNSLVAFPNRVPKYQFNKNFNTYELSTFEAGNRSLAGNGLNITLNSFLEWNTKLDNNKLLKEETKLKMMSPFQYEDGNSSFGHSWGIYGPKGKQYYGFAGGGVNALMKFIDKDLTIIILSNGFKNRPVISNAVNYISGLMDEELVRKDRMLNEDIRLAFIINDYKTAVEIYKQIKQDNKGINFERGLGSSGYFHLSNNEIAKSISIFKLHTKEYPNSHRAFDILGEAYFMNQQYDLSKKNYKISLDLEPKNKNAKDMLKKIEEITNANTVYI
ncbi:serine hydrolase [Olleya aquimaris]|nr:serine hydrolase [Olleya aquimaris]